MKVDVLLGLQWGDEGKGKIVDVLSPSYDIIARFQGGPNAGHTLVFNGKKHILHTIPSGIFHQDTLNIIGNGVLLDPVIFEREVKRIEECNARPEHNLKISKKTHLILPGHRLLDAALEHSKGDAKIGSTLKGIGPAYTDKTARTGIRIIDLNNPGFMSVYEQRKDHHLRIIRALGFESTDFQIESTSFEEYEKFWFAALETLGRFETIDCEYFINDALNNGKRILAEGAQGSLLDIDHGSYPYVTSSSTTTAGVCSGLGLAPSRIGRVMGIFKAYATRVGSGPFPTELLDETGDTLRIAGKEFGSTTGRPRRCGWLDLAALKYANMINGTTELIMTKADVLENLNIIKTALEYTRDGETTSMISRACNETGFVPVYTEHTGWKKKLGELTSTNELPVEFQAYIRYIELQTTLPISIISTGPDRKQTIIRKL